MLAGTFDFYSKKTGGRQKGMVLYMSKKYFNVEKFGHNLRSFRKSRNISIEVLASNAKVSPEHIRNLETGNSNPSVPVLIALANTLQVSLDDLLRDSMEFPPKPNTILTEKLSEIDACDFDFIIDLVSLIQEHFRLKTYADKINADAQGKD